MCMARGIKGVEGMVDGIRLKYKEGADDDRGGGSGGGWFFFKEQGNIIDCRQKQNKMRKYIYTSFFFALLLNGKRENKRHYSHDYTHGNCQVF